MARARRKVAPPRRRKPVDEPKFVKQLPPRGGVGIWVERLRPLVTRPGIWAQIFEARTDNLAQRHVDNLNRRLVRIPHPDHGWEFSSRDNLVFAIYRRAKRKVPK